MINLGRPILVAVIGYILGIIGGLYFSFSMVPFFIAMAVIFLIRDTYLKNKYIKTKRIKKGVKILSIRRYFRYIKLFINRNVIILLFITAIISNIIVCNKNKYYETLRQELQKQNEFTGYGIICSGKEEKEYRNLYKIKVKNDESKVDYFYITIDKKSDIELTYGDIVQISGIFQTPEVRRNEGGFDYSEYLKQEKVIGTIKVDNFKIIQENGANEIMQVAHCISNKSKQRIKQLFKEDIASLLIGILLGDESGLKEEIEENFRNANLSHILAVSGMHMSYLILGTQKIFCSLLGKRKSYIISIFVIVGYLFLAGFSPSLVRAGVMGICFLFSKVIYRKNDFWTSISISLLIILISNPFLILNVGLQFSYVGVIGIVLGDKVFKDIFHEISIKKLKRKLKRGKYHVNKNKTIFLAKIQEILIVTLSAQIAILPIMIYHFNQFYSYFIITNLLVSFLIGPIVLCGFLILILTFLPYNIFQIFKEVITIFIPFIEKCVELLLAITKISQLPFSKVYLKTPNIISIVFYYFIIVILAFFYKVFHSKKSTATNSRIKNLVALFRYKIRGRKIEIYFFIILIFIVYFIFMNIPRGLKINFVDVGQGDCTFIETPYKKSILIDGGGVLGSDFSVGEKTLIPYLLDKGYTKIDTVIISHFDQDHVDGILTVLEELKVGQVYISKQYEISDNYKKFIKIIKERNIKISILNEGDKIKIEKNLQISVLWPEEEQISENPLNNNSFVLKMEYGEVSCLFTGDIEKIAEEKLLEKYKNKELEATILKVAHHGSKTSTIDEFLEKVDPKIAMIGVGKNNKFGHPSEQVIRKLEENGTVIFRTDLMGEVCLYVSRKGKIRYSFRTRTSY